MLLLILLLAGIAHAAGEQPQISWEPHVGARLPLELRFVDEDGRIVTLGEHFSGAPVILVFSYYRCSGLCPLVLQGVAEAVPDVPAGVVAISIDPRDQPAEAGMRRRQVAGSDVRTASMHFLTDPDGASARQVAAAAGFGYAYDPQLDQYAHPAGIVIAGPDGVIRSYLYGVRFSRDALLAAVSGQRSAAAAGDNARPLLLLCFHFDPQTGRYTLSVVRILRVAGVVLLAALALWMWRHRRSTGEA